MDNNPVNSLRKGEKAAKYSAYTNLFLAIIKGIVGIFAGSVALVADSIHSFSDIFSSLAVYLGLKISQRKPDEKFPYGYYKVETLVSLIISVLIVITGFEIAFESFNDFLNPSSIEFPIISLLTAILSVLVSYILAKYKEKIGKEIGSQALINDGKHSMVDVFSSFIVFLGVFASYLGYVSIQGIAGFSVSLLVIYIGLKLGKDDILVLLDAGVSPEKVDAIKNIVGNMGAVYGVHDIKIRKSGPFLFAELHLELNRGESIKNTDEILGEIENKVKNEIPNLDQLLIQVKPAKMSFKTIAVPIKDNNGLSSEVTSHFGKSAYFIIAIVEEGTITNYKIIKNPARTDERKKGISTAKLLKKENVDLLIIKHLAEGPKNVFGDYLEGIIAPNGNNLEEIIINASKIEN